MKNFITLLLVIAVVATWYLAPTPQPEPTTAEISSDYFIVQFDRKQMDRQGRVASTFHADRLDHYPQLNRAEMVQPRAITYSDNAPPWYLRADHGVRHEEDNHISLSGDVVANQRYRDSDRFTLIESELLELFMDQDYLTTDQQITFTTESSVTRSLGAKAWLESGRLLLLEQTASHYQP